MLIASLPLFGCGNALDGGSSPSGTYITASADQSATLEPDIFLTICTEATETSPAVYESGLTNTYLSVTFHNKSAPNTPEGQSTNNDVTMSRYRVDYTGLNKTVKIKSFDGAGSTVIVPKDSTASMTVNVMPLEILEYIRNHYPTIGVSEGLELRATVTIWGEDPFDVTVQTQVEVTLSINDYNRC
jgi:hypothetical protein